MKTEKWMLPIAEKSAHSTLDTRHSTLDTRHSTLDTRHSTLQPVKKRHRRKAHLGWEQADRDSNGLYARSVETLTQKFRKLTPMELRVCAMVKEAIPSWLIAEKFGITEKAIENYRVRARKKMNIHSRKRLTYYLTKI